MVWVVVFLSRLFRVVIIIMCLLFGVILKLLICMLCWLVMWFIYGVLLIILISGLLV